MDYEDLGFNEDVESIIKSPNAEGLLIGRVIQEHKERYVVKTPDMEYEAELLGNLRFTAESRYDYPAVGDWVAFMSYDEDKGLIQSILPRKSLIERKAAGKSGQVQIIASNIDYGLIVQSINRDFNLNRLERYLTICYSSQVKPIIILSKADLVSEAELELLINQILSRIDDVPVVPVSSESIGYGRLEAVIEKGKTYCLLGSSGVGKSTLLNHLAGKEEMKTGEISSSVNKGRHVTSHRELFILERGGMIIDNPGMREVGITDSEEGLETTFDIILSYSDNCRYKDCTHMHEEGCAILEAVEKGEIDSSSYNNFRKMEKERMHFESDAQDRKRKDKELGRLIKEVKKKGKRL